MNAETKLLHFLHAGLLNELETGIDCCFEKDADPEVSWAMFREGLKRLKKEHIEYFNAYKEYLKACGEMDSEEEAPESEISKWRNELKQHSLKNKSNEN
jgi:dihydroorotase-like cyclic amidohydrolase